MSDRVKCVRTVWSEQLISSLRQIHLASSRVKDSSASEALRAIAWRHAIAILFSLFSVEDESAFMISMRSLVTLFSASAQRLVMYASGVMRCMFLIVRPFDFSGNSYMIEIIRFSCSCGTWTSSRAFLESAPTRISRTSSMKKDFPRLEACQQTRAELGSNQILMRLTLFDVCLVTQVPCSKTADIAGAIPPSKLLNALEALLGRPTMLASPLWRPRTLEGARDDGAPLECDRSSMTSSGTSGGLSSSRSETSWARSELLLSLRRRMRTGPALWSRIRIDWVVDALRLSLLWAPRDSLRIRPGLFPVIASDIALGGTVRV